MFIQELFLLNEKKRTVSNYLQLKAHQVATP